MSAKAEIESDFTRKSELLEEEPLIAPTAHYFATFAYGWQTAETLEGAIAKLIEFNESTFKRLLRNGGKYDPSSGVYIWACLVNGPRTYTIDFYRPVGVELLKCQNYRIYRVTKSQIDYIVGDPVTRRIER